MKKFEGVKSVHSNIDWITHVHQNHVIPLGRVTEKTGDIRFEHTNSLMPEKIPDPLGKQWNDESDQAGIMQKL